MKAPFCVVIPSYFTYAVVYLLGNLRDLFQIFKQNKSPEGYAPLCRDYEDFYKRRMFHRVQDCFNRPIGSAPNTWIDIIERVAINEKDAHVRTNNTIKCLNLGSYNYLGFAAQDEYCTPRVLESLQKFGASVCSSRVDCGMSRFSFVCLQLEPYSRRSLWAK